MPGRFREHKGDSTFADYYRRSVEPHLGRLLALGQRLLGSQDLAWDALQESLVSLWQLASRPAEPAAWLMQTLLHRCLHLRRCRVRRLRNEQQAGLAVADPVRQDPADCLEQQERQQQVQDALEQLPADYRAVLVLRELEQMDYEAIASNLNLPLGTVRSRLNRARTALRAVSGQSRALKN